MNFCGFMLVFSAYSIARFYYYIVAILFVQNKYHAKLQILYNTIFPFRRINCPVWDFFDILPQIFFTCEFLHLNYFPQT